MEPKKTPPKHVAPPDSVQAGEPNLPKALTSGTSPLAWRRFRIVICLIYLLFLPDLSRSS